MLYEVITIHFKLIVANIKANVTGSHFHMAPVGANAGVVVNLLNISDFPPPTTAPVNGVLARITSYNVCYTKLLRISNFSIFIGKSRILYQYPVFKIFVGTNKI